MTHRQLVCLSRAAQYFPGFNGSALMFEYQAGYTRQVKWLVARKLARVQKGRVIATAAGRKVLAYQQSA